MLAPIAGEGEGVILVARSRTRRGASWLLFALTRVAWQLLHTPLTTAPSPPRRANNTGGANGSVRLELAGLSRGMQQAGALCAAWRSVINARLAADPQVPRGTAISFADIFQMAGAAAVIVTGGPSTAALWDALPVGRIDSPAASITAAAPAAPVDNVALLPVDTLDFTRLACIFGEGWGGWGGAGRGRAGQAGAGVGGLHWQCCLRGASLPACPPLLACCCLHPGP